MKITPKQSKSRRSASLSARVIGLSKVGPETGSLRKSIPNIVPITES